MNLELSTLNVLLVLAVLAIGCGPSTTASSVECTEGPPSESARPCPPGMFCRAGVCLWFNTSRSDAVDPEADASDGGP